MKRWDEILGEALAQLSLSDLCEFIADAQVSGKYDLAKFAYDILGERVTGK